MKLTNITLGLCVGLLAGSPLMMGQQVNAYFGVGAATAPSSNQSLNLLGNGNFTTPAMTGAFLSVGGSAMFTSHFGAGADLSWRASQGDYAGVNYRPFFYDFNGIWQPLKSKRFVPEVQAGIGGVRVGFSANQQSCADPLVGCQTVSVGSESSSHFQTHIGVAARIYVTPSIFLRPAVDAHYVDNFFQFGSNWVPEYSVGLGYSFGGR
jgi:hypothetical protein